MVRLILMAVALFGVPVAQAASAPYSLCAGLNDSSGQPGGAQLYTCDSVAVDRTLESMTFGTYTGTARASSDAFDTVRLYASAQLVDYLPNSYVPAPSGGIEFAASATATYTEQVAITGPAALAVLHLSFSVTGTLTQASASAQLCYAFAYGGPITGGPCAVGLPPLITVESEPFVPDGTLRPLNFQFSAVVFNRDEGMGAPYSAAATADLEHTITLQELLVTTPEGLPVAGIELRSAGEFDYPLSSLNQVPAIPEPRSAILMLAALGLLGLRLRRKSQF